MSTAPGRQRPPILLTGATGYVGGRLLRALEERGERVCCLTRRPEAVAPHRDTTTVVAGDVLDPDSLRPAMRGVETAYYLVHSMTSAASFEQEDRRGAGNFAAAALEAGVRRIVYLGGLGAGGDLSSHLSSRQEVGHILADSGVQTIEFRASIVIGSGSLSFEMLRTLVERLPVMITPRWVRTKAQPIAIEDVLDYLVAALDVELDSSTVFEIGGADRVSYEELMREYARQIGVRRWIIPVPVLTARLSSLWLGLVTPVYARVGRKLIDSLPHETVVRDASAGGLSRSSRAATGGDRAGLANEDREFSETRWSDAVSSAGLQPERYGGVRHGKRRVDSRAVEVPVAPAQAFRPIRRIGGEPGWYFGNRSGGCADSSTCWSAASACAAAGGRRDTDRGLGAGLLARRGLRAEPSAAAARRDEAPGTCVAAVRGDTAEPGQHDPPDGDLPPPACSARPTGTASSPSTRGSSKACWPRSQTLRRPREGSRRTLPGITGDLDHA